MTWFHYVQIAFGLAVAGFIAWRMRVLFFEAALDAGPFLPALRRVLAEEGPEAARDLAAAARPAWVGRVAHAGLEARLAGGDVSIEVEEELGELRFEAGRGVGALRVLASVATATAVLGGVVELIGVLGGGQRGLEGLMAGLAEKLAFERALLAVALGVAIALVCYTARGAFRAQATALVRDMVRAAELVDRPPGPDPSGPVGAPAGGTGEGAAETPDRGPGEGSPGHQASGP